MSRWYALCKLFEAKWERRGECNVMCRGEGGKGGKRGKKQKKREKKTHEFFNIIRVRFERRKTNDMADEHEFYVLCSEVK